MQSINSNTDNDARGICLLLYIKLYLHVVILGKFELIYVNFFYLIRDKIWFSRSNISTWNTVPMLDFFKLYPSYRKALNLCSRHFSILSRSSV